MKADGFTAACVIENRERPVESVLELSKVTDSISITVAEIIVLEIVIKCQD